MNVLLEKSLINCHCYGLDSLVLKDADDTGGMVRIFVARPEHELWKNHPDTAEAEGEALSIALHPHHCDVTLMPLVGDVYNVTVDDGDIQRNRLRADIQGDLRALYFYRYVSPITHGAGRFEPINPDPIEVWLEARKLRGPLFLRSPWRHTIYVPKGETAAWVVCEGAEDELYRPMVLSDALLEEYDFTGTNAPMTPERLREDLAILNVYEVPYA